MGKFFFFIVSLIVLIIGIQAYYYGIEHDKYCRTINVDPKDWQYVQRKMKSRDPYNVIHLDQDLLNYFLEKAQQDEMVDYEICARIDPLRNRLQLFLAKSPLWWFTITIKSSEEKPYIQVTNITYGVIPLPGFIQKTLQSEIVNNYRTYFEKKIPMRNIEKLEIQDGELIIYTKYY